MNNKEKFESLVVIGKLSGEVLENVQALVNEENPIITQDLIGVYNEIFNFLAEAYIYEYPKYEKEILEFINKFKLDILEAEDYVIENNLTR